MTDLFRDLQSALAEHYAIERELGQGGMATVYLAQDLKHHRRVAIKVLRPELAAALGSERFQREIRVAGQLSHPHILPLHDSGEAGGFLYYTMPFVEGESLRDRLERQKQLSLDEALAITHQVASALDHAHGRGVIHRDIKPENILLAGTEAVVADFGIAKAISVAGGEKLTETGLAIGTPAYMSPEQAGGERDLDGRADVYALGCVLYEMLAGQPPFTGPTAQSILARHAVDPVPSLHTVRRAVPRGVEQAIEQALEKVPADRFATAAEFAGALEDGRVGGRRVQVRRGRRWIVPAVLATVLLIGSATMLRIRAGRPPVISAATVIAVLPFAPSVADTGLTRLGRDLVFTLSANLDYVGEIRTVDPHTVLAQTATAPNRDMSLPDAGALGRRFGAGSVVHGSVVRLGPDLVRVDFGLYTSDSLTPVVQASVTASSDSVALLSDSISQALLQQIWRRGEAPTPSLEAALSTRSPPALRAFLEGEQRLSENRWSAAAEAYARAVAADSSFRLANWRRIYALGWSGGVFGPEDVSAVIAHRAQLPAADRGIIESGMIIDESLSVAISRFRQLAERYPDNWLVWMDYGDKLVHLGPLLGISPEVARAALRRATELNPRLIPAWQHLIWVDLMLFDTMSTAAVLDTLTRLDAAPLLKEGQNGQDEMLEIRFLSSLERGESPSPFFRDSVAREIGDRDWVGPVTPFAYGFAGAQLEIDRRAIELGVEPSRAAELLWSMGRSWASRGAWDSALAVTDRHVRASAGIDASAPLSAYRLAVLAAWVGASSPVEADRRRAAASRAMAQLETGQQVEMAWLDGLLAFARGDRSALSAARHAVEGLGAPVTARTLRAMDLLLKGSRREAAESLAILQWQQTEKGYGDIWEVPSLLPVGRMLAAQWLIAEGDSSQALRLLAWTHAFFQHGGTPISGMFFGLIALERARIEETTGDIRQAQADYEWFLRAYDRPVAQHRHLVDEARAALKRLSGQQDPPARR